MAGLKKDVGAQEKRSEGTIGKSVRFTHALFFWPMICPKQMGKIDKDVVQNGAKQAFQGQMRDLSRTMEKEAESDVLPFFSQPCLPSERFCDFVGEGCVSGWGEDTESAPQRCRLQANGGTLLLASS